MQYHEHIAEVYKRIAAYIKKTPVLTSSYFSQKTGSTLFFKCENLQYTNAFKVRGAFSKITNMLDKNKIIITASAGNHGLAVSFAADILEKDKLFVEPASSCALSAVISGKIPHIKDKKVAVILSGGNFSLEQLKAYL